MSGRLLLWGLVALSLVSCSTSAPKPDTAAIDAAIASTDRPAADKARDAQRHPDQVLAFYDVRPGMQIFDFVAGGGYYTELFSHLAGPGGKVYATRLAPERIANARLANVTSLADTSWPIAPGTIDIVFTAQNYHDIIALNLDRKPILAAILGVLKPGGTFAVSDHAAEDGSGTRDAATLHRIDEKVVRDEVTAAGFEFVAESGVLRRADDPRKAHVITGGIRGATDQFVLKFRKPL